MNIDYISVPGGSLILSVVHNHITADVYFSVDTSIKGRRAVYYYRTFKGARNKFNALAQKYGTA